MTTTNRIRHPQTTAEPTTRRPRRWLRRAILVTLATVTVGLAAGGTAQAINPPQSNHAGVVYQLGGFDRGAIGEFWSTAFSAWGRRDYRHPRIYFYNTATVGNFDTGGCGSTSNHPRNGVYCGRSESIFFDYTDMNTRVARFGDYGTGGLLAHEFAHHIQHLLGYPHGSYKAEYHADCLAGMYTRYGYASGKLTGGDYWEYHNWLLSTPQSTSHGNPSIRTEWYRYGYQTYSLAHCNLAYR